MLAARVHHPTRQNNPRRIHPTHRKTLLPPRKHARRNYDMSPLNDIQVTNIVTRAHTRPVTQEEALEHFPSRPGEKFQKLGSGTKYCGVDNTSLRFPGGSVVCVGGNDINGICVHLHMTRADYSQRFGGEPIVSGPLTVQNIVCSDSFDDFSVDLEQFYQNNPLNTSYEPRVFPGVRSITEHPSDPGRVTKINLFGKKNANGDIVNNYVMMGLNNPQDVIATRNNFIAWARESRVKKAIK